MGISLGNRRSHQWQLCLGYCLIEQLVAAALVLVAALCLLEGLAYCLVCLQASEARWERDLREWNQVQHELSKEVEDHEMENREKDY